MRGDDPDRAPTAPGLSDATPLDEAESAGLKPSWVATRADLNAAEQAAIAGALGQRRWWTLTTDQLLDDLTARKLHQAMFGDVWAWAGKYRTTERNLGIAPERISIAVRDLMADARMWIAGDAPMPSHEAAYRFHHALVAIHPFPNGNGRHARAMADLLLAALGQDPFTWGRLSRAEAADIRARYIAALRSADRGDFTALAAFVLS